MVLYDCGWGSLAVAKASALNWLKAKVQNQRGYIESSGETVLLQAPDVIATVRDFVVKLLIHALLKTYPRTCRSRRIVWNQDHDSYVPMNIIIVIEINVEQQRISDKN